MGFRQLAGPVALSLRRRALAGGDERRGILRTCCVLRSKVAHNVRTTSSNAMAVIGRPPTVRFCPRGQARGEEAGAPGPGAPLRGPTGEPEKGARRCG